MSGFLWKATARNVNRALKEINAFEWEGDYRPEVGNRLKDLLEEKMYGQPRQIKYSDPEVQKLANRMRSKYKK